jgi:hypothetical protein
MSAAMGAKLRFGINKLVSVLKLKLRFEGIVVQIFFEKRRAFGQFAEQILGFATATRLVFVRMLVSIAMILFAM